MRAKEIFVPATMLGLAAGYVWTSLPPAILQSSDQRARIERSAAIPEFQMPVAHPANRSRRAATSS